MKDSALTAAPAKTAAGQAVLYLLRRIRVDVNLRYYMLGTEAFALLCKAEAERSGKAVDVVASLYSDLAEHCLEDVPDVVTARKKLEDIREALQDEPRYGVSKSSAIYKIREILG